MWLPGLLQLGVVSLSCSGSKKIDSVGGALVNILGDLSVDGPGIQTFARPTPEQQKQDQKLTKKVESLLSKAQQYVNEASELIEKSQ